MQRTYTRVLAPPGAPQPAPPEARRPDFPGAPADAHERIAGLSVELAGAGSVGMAFALLAARYGVGELSICDPGTLKPASVLTHPVPPSAVGRPKALWTAERVLEIHPGARVFACVGKVEELALSAAAGARYLVIAPDNLACAVAAGQRAQHRGQTLLYGSLHGSTLCTTVRVLRESCPLCLLGERDRDELAAERRYSCSGEELPDRVPTVAPAALCSLAGAQLFLSLLRLVLGVGDELVDTVQDYSGLSHRALVTRVGRRADCPVDHSPWNLWEAPRALAGLTPRELFQLAEAAHHPLGELSLAIPGLTFLHTGLCTCGERPALERFTAIEGAALPCPACGAPLLPDPLATHAAVPGELLARHLDQPLRALGAADPHEVHIQVGARTVLLCAPRHPEEVRP